MAVVADAGTAGSVVAEGAGGVCTEPPGRVSTVLATQATMTQKPTVYKPMSAHIHHIVVLMPCAHMTMSPVQPEGVVTLDARLPVLGSG